MFGCVVISQELLNKTYVYMNLRIIAIKDMALF